MIKSMLDEKCNFTQIAAAIGKDRTTVSREVRNASVILKLLFFFRFLSYKVMYAK